MLTAEYRKSDEYKSLYATIVAIEPELPTVLVEQAIYMHLKDPFLYRKILKIEKVEARSQRKMQGKAALKQRCAMSTEAITTSHDDADDVHGGGEVSSGLGDTVDDIVVHVHDVQESDSVQVGITDDLEKS